MFNRNKSRKEFGINFSACKECTKIYHKKHFQEKNSDLEWRAENAERKRKWDNNNKWYGKQWRDNNKEAIKKIQRKYYDTHKKEEYERVRRWQKNNKEKWNEYQRRRFRERYKEDPVFREKVYRKGVERQAITKQQTPKLNKLNLERIQNIYTISTILGPTFHVDHIVPLSKNGLHHPDNLQIIPAKDNLSKNNKLDYHIPLDRRFILNYN